MRDIAKDREILAKPFPADKVELLGYAAFLRDVALEYIDRAEQAEEAIMKAKCSEHGPCPDMVEGETKVQGCIRCILALAKEGEK